MGPLQRLRRALFYDAVRDLTAHGDAVISTDGRTATLAVYAHSYRSPVGIARWPDGGVQVDDREGLDVYTVDVATRVLRKVGSLLVDRRLFRIQRSLHPVWFEYRRGPLHYLVGEGHGPYGTLRHVADVDVPRRVLRIEVDTDSGEVRELDEAAYARATVGAESLRLGRLGRFLWEVEAERWVDTWGPSRQIGGRHVRAIPARGAHTVLDARLQFVHEDPAVKRKPGNPVVFAEIGDWPAHRR